MERLILCGGGHVSLEAAYLAAHLEFEVTVIDDRAEFANRERFPMAAQVICAPFLEALDGLGEPVLRREGHRSGTWVLLDFGCLVVHVFTDETRKFYDLERLWNDATPVPLDAVIS